MTKIIIELDEDGIEQKIKEQNIKQFQNIKFSWDK